MALQMQPSIPDGLGLHNLGILVVLTAAALWRWPAPRPRAALLAATAVALLLWTLIAIRSPHGVSHVTAQPHPTLAWMVGGAVVGALVAGVFARRRQRLTIMTMMVVGMCGGLALPTAAPWLSYHSTNGWLLCVTASISLLGVAGGPPPNRQAHSGNQLDGHARGPATGSAWLSAYECRK
jgi:peptidoglycan/LPS O-acetylase OafA/YrhL